MSHARRNEPCGVRYAGANEKFSVEGGCVRHLSAQMSPVQTGANEIVMFRNVPIILAQR